MEELVMAKRERERRSRAETKIEQSQSVDFIDVLPFHSHVLYRSVTHQTSASMLTVNIQFQPA